MTPQTDSDADGPSDEPTKAERTGLARGLPGRREALFLLGGGVLGTALGGGAAGLALRPASATVRDDSEEISAKQGRELLEAGNARYLAGESIHPDQSPERRDLIASSQKPFCAVLACADSRVPPEVIFDQGLGDLFVVRSAGQVIDHAVMGSLQYGVDHLKTPLLLVLGHSQCGAVKATVESMTAKAKPSGTDIDALVAAIQPAVVEAKETGADEDRLMSVSIDVNVDMIVERLKKAPVIGHATTLREVKVLGAVYSVKTGEVHWL